MAIEKTLDDIATGINRLCTLVEKCLETSQGSEVEKTPPAKTTKAKPKTKATKEAAPKDEDIPERPEIRNYLVHVLKRKRTLELLNELGFKKFDDVPDEKLSEVYLAAKALVESDD